MKKCIKIFSVMIICLLIIGTPTLSDTINNNYSQGDDGKAFYTNLSNYSVKPTIMLRTNGEESGASGG